MNYNNKIFRSVQNSNNGDVSVETTFHYFQKDEVIWADYSGGAILNISQDLTIKTGVCQSTPEITEDGRIRLHEHWQWTNGDLSKGYSVLEEVVDE